MTNSTTNDRYEEGFRNGAGLSIEAATVLFRAIRWHRGEEGLEPLRRAVRAYIVENEKMLKNSKGRKNEIR